MLRVIGQSLTQTTERPAPITMQMEIGGMIWWRVLLLPCLAAEMFLLTFQQRRPSNVLHHFPAFADFQTGFHMGQFPKDGWNGQNVAFFNVSRSDHSLRMSVTHSLTDSLTNLLKIEWVDLNICRICRICRISRLCRLCSLCSLSRLCRQTKPTKPNQKNKSNKPTKPTKPNLTNQT